MSDPSEPQVEEWMETTTDGSSATKADHQLPEVQVDEWIQNTNAISEKTKDPLPFYRSHYYQHRIEFCPFPFYPVCCKKFSAILASYVRDHLLLMKPWAEDPKYFSKEAENARLLKINRKLSPHGLIDVSVLMTFRTPYYDMVEFPYNSYIFYLTLPDPENGKSVESYNRKSAFSLSRQQKCTLEDINAKVKLFLDKPENSHQAEALSLFLEPIFIDDNNQTQALWLAVSGGTANQFGLYDPEKTDQEGPATSGYFSLFKIRKTPRVVGWAENSGPGFSPLWGCIRYFNWLRMPVKSEEQGDGDIDPKLDTLIKDITRFQCLLFSAYNNPDTLKPESEPEPRIGNINQSNPRPHYVKTEDGSSFRTPYSYGPKVFISEDVTRKLGSTRSCITKFTKWKKDDFENEEEYRKNNAEVREHIGPYSNVWIWFESRITDLLTTSKSRIDDAKEERKTEAEDDRREQQKAPEMHTMSTDAACGDSASIASTNSSEYRDPVTGDLKTTLEGGFIADEATDDSGPAPWTPYPATDIYVRSLHPEDWQAFANGPAEFDDDNTELENGELGGERRLNNLQAARVLPFSNNGAIPPHLLPEALRDDRLIRVRGKDRGIEELSVLVKRLRNFAPAFTAGNVTPGKSESDPATLFGVFPQPTAHWGMQACHSILVDLSTGELGAVADWSTDSLVVPEWRAAIPPHFLWGPSGYYAGEDGCRNKLRKLYNEKMQQGFKGKHTWSVFEEDWRSVLASLRTSGSNRDSDDDSAEFAKKALDALWVMVMMDIDLLLLGLETLDDHDIAVELIDGWPGVKAPLRGALEEFITKVAHYLDIFDSANPSACLKRLLEIEPWARIKVWMFFELGDGEVPPERTEAVAGATEPAGTSSDTVSNRSASPSTS